MDNAQQPRKSFKAVLRDTRGRIVKSTLLAGAAGALVLGGLALETTPSATIGAASTISASHANGDKGGKGDDHGGGKGDDHGGDKGKKPKPPCHHGKGVSGERQGGDHDCGKGDDHGGSD